MLNNLWRKKLQAPKRPHELIVHRVEPQNTFLGIYFNSGTCEGNEIRRHPSNQVVGLHFSLCTVAVLERPEIPDHPHPGIVRRYIIDIKKALRLYFCYSVREIVVWKVRKESASA